MCSLVQQEPQGFEGLLTRIAFVLESILAARESRSISQFLLASS